MLLEETTNLFLKSGVATELYVCPSQRFQPVGSDCTTPDHIIIPPCGIGAALTCFVTEPFDSLTKKL